MEVSLHTSSSEERGTSDCVLLREDDVDSERGNVGGIIDVTGIQGSGMNDGVGMNVSAKKLGVGDAWFRFFEKSVSKVIVNYAIVLSFPVETT